jgi:hypothetical protein
MRQFLLAAALAASFAPAGVAQENGREIKASLAWTSPDGGLHFTVPAGWLVAATGEKDVVLGVSKSDPTTGASGIECNVRIVPMGRAQPAVTQETISAKISVGAGANLEARRVRSVDGVAVVDGAVPVKPRAGVEMLAAYIHGDEGHAVNVLCVRNPASELTSDDLKTIHSLLDSISFTH